MVIAARVIIAKTAHYLGKSSSCRPIRLAILLQINFQIIIAEMEIPERKMMRTSLHVQFERIITN